MCLVGNKLYHAIIITNRYYIIEVYSTYNNHIRDILLAYYSEFRSKHINKTSILMK